MMANRKWQRDINTVAGGWGGLTGQCVLQPTEAHRLTLAVKVRWMILKKKKKMQCEDLLQSEPQSWIR